MIQQNLQNRNRLTDIEKKLMITQGEHGGEGINLEFGISRYTLLYVNQMNKYQLYRQEIIFSIL